MELNDFYRRFILDRSLEEKAGFNPYYCELQSGLIDPIVIDGQDFINLASNNYLGLAADLRVTDSAAEALHKYGASLCGTPIATGYIDLFKKLEKRLSRFVGLESSIILPSCYQANNGLFLSVAGSQDLIIIDHYAHSSLIQGANAAGCKVRPFLHNNLEHLKGILENSSKYRQVFVVTESVFSTDGSIAPLKGITELALQFSAVPVVDDSHGIGVIGKSGRGILEYCGMENYPGIYTASLGKALANSGGMIAGRSGFIEYMKYYCPHLVYSTAIPPSVLGGINKVIDIIENDFEDISIRMWKYRDLLRDCLLECGFRLSDSKAPITSICAGNSDETIALARTFFENKILTTPFIAPSVPLKEGKVRLIAGANLEEETINTVLDVIEKSRYK
jgi:glycine C-acetyltransferase